MGDLERLNKALDRFEVTRPVTIEGQEGAFVAPATEDDVLAVFEAASSYADLLANGERVEWCETHGYPPWHGYDLSHDVAVCEYAMRGSHRPCSFVSRLPVDPPKEEE